MLKYVALVLVKTFQNCIFQLKKKKKNRTWEKEGEGKTFKADLKQGHIFSITTNPWLNTNHFFFSSQIANQ